MKSNKVLLGLFVGVLALVGGNVRATEDTNFVEMGPVNVGGHVTSLIVDQTDASHTTVYAGAVSGGLFVRSGNDQVLQTLYSSRHMSASLAEKKDIWHYVPYVDNNGVETVLPINCMVQPYGGDIFIGTGDDVFQYGSSYKPMSTKGHGIYRFNPSNFTYERIAATSPTVNPDFEVVRALDYIHRDGNLYLFAVTKGGIYRLTKADNQTWNDASITNICPHDSVDEFVVVRSLKMAYFTVGGHLYKIGDVTASTANCVDVTSTNPAFSEAVALRIAVAPSDPSYLYVMAINSTGLMEGLYLTRDMQRWTLLNSSTVNPFSRSRVNGKLHVNGDGRRCGAVAVDPDNPQRVFIAGSSVWIGQNYVDGSYYQWTKASYCEQELNYGNYMSGVFSSAMFVHSGIHQIVAAYPPDTVRTFYIATDGGVYSTSNDFGYFENINRGLNNVQVNSVAVCPDGSLISGAKNNACPMIESRTTHDGGDAEVAWYDNGRHGNLNHDANVLWTGEGGQVAASMFQQFYPMSRRTIFVSSADAQYGRSYADYFDYTNTQTWTSNKSFSSNELFAGSDVSYMHLWETAEDTYFNDSISSVIDTLGYVLRLNTQTQRYDTVWMNSSRFQIQAGDKMNVLNKAFAEYPIEHTFTTPQLATGRVKVKSPLQSRMLLIATDSLRSEPASGNRGPLWRVWISWRATDFSKVWARQASDEHLSAQQLWSGIYTIDTASVRDTTQRHQRPRAAVMSADGRFAFITVQDFAENKSMIVRISGFENVDFSATAREIYGQMKLADRLVTKLHADTFYVSGTNMWLPRPVSSLTYDTANGAQRLILTFEDYSDSYANVAVINDAQSDSWALETMAITSNRSLPVYCSMVERTTGDIYVGTADGVWIKNATGWEKYGHLSGVAVTSIIQQKANLPTRKHTGHNGINVVDYRYAKTKWPNAIYFGTYGRGIFMDMTYVTDRVNEISNPDDYNIGIPTVDGSDLNSVSIYPNPVAGDAHIDITAAEAGNAHLRIYDLNGRCVMENNLGHINEGTQTYTFSTQGMARGMYLVNVTIGGRTSATKMMVR